MSVNPVMNQSCWFHFYLVFHNAVCNTTNPKQHSHKSCPIFWFFLPNPSNQIHAVVMPVSSIFPPMPNSCQMHAGFSWIQSRRSSNTIRLFWYCFDSLMLNSCWFQFHLECQNALRNTLHDNCFAQYSTWQWCWPHAEFMLNPCWIQANPWKLYVFTTFATCREIPDYVSNNRRVIIIILNRRKFRSLTSDNMQSWKAE